MPILEQRSKLLLYCVLFLLLCSQLYKSRLVCSQTSENLNDKDNALVICWSMESHIPVPSWSRWWQRWTSSCASCRDIPREETNQGAKQESTRVQAASAIGETKWSEGAWEPQSLSTLVRRRRRKAQFKQLVTFTRCVCMRLKMERQNTGLITERPM